jgi:hypothetical protein
VLRFALASLLAAPLLTTGFGKDEALVVTDFPAAERARYEIFKVRCTKCHAMSRPIKALQEGKTPISGDKFDDSFIKKYVIKMMRKPNSGINKEDAKEIILFLHYARARVTGEPAGEPYLRSPDTENTAEH